MSAVPKVVKSLSASWREAVVLTVLVGEEVGSFFNEVEVTDTVCVADFKISVDVVSTVDEIRLNDACVVLSSETRNSLVVESIVLLVVVEGNSAFVVLSEKYKWESM